MSRDPLLRLQDILQYCDRQAQSIASLQYETFLNDEDAVDASFARLTIIGEAVNNLPNELLQSYPDIPWRDIVGMRNYLVHAYFGVNLKLLWDTITVELPKLRTAVEALIITLDRPANTDQ